MNSILSLISVIVCHIGNPVAIAMNNNLSSFQEVYPDRDNTTGRSYIEAGVHSVGAEYGDYTEWYEYDIMEAHSTFWWSELVPTLAVYGLTLIIGLVGNTLIVFTTCRFRRMHSATNVFLASLASADLLLIVFCIPVKVAKLFSYTWAMGLFLCKCVHYMQSVSAICSVLTLTAMSMERYYAIVHPMKAKYICTISQARRIILVTWALAFILAVPILFTQIQMSVGERVKAFWCVRNWDNQPLWRSHEIYMLILVLIAPTCVMVFAYTAICWEIWQVMERRYHMTSRHALNTNYHNSHESIPMDTLRSKDGRCKAKSTVVGAGSIASTQSRKESRTVRQVIHMLVAVVVLFVICWAPMLIDNVLTAYQVLPSVRIGPLKYMGTAFHLMAYFNSCINPIVYGFMSKNFRESFCATICCTRNSSTDLRAGVQHKRRSHIQRTRSVSQTRTTSVRNPVH